MNSRPQIWIQPESLALRLIMALCVCSFSIANGQVSPKPNKSGATYPRESLELLDGSILRGKLQAIDSGKGLTWEYPDAKQPIDFKPDNLAWIRFPQATNSSVQAAAQSKCQFRFANGDDFFGNLVALNEKELEMETWFGGKFKTPRDAVRSIRFFGKGVATVYEGPTGFEGWKIGKNQTPQAWQFSDGAFIANSVGTLGRDFLLPDASRLEFDLAWNAPFSLLLSYYTEIVDTFNYNNGTYMFYINPGSVSLQRINGTIGSSTLGRTETITQMLTRKNVHLEFRANKSESVIELLVDGKLVNQWKDNGGWAGKGSGVLFFAQSDGAGIKVSNLKVSEWDGNPGSEIVPNSPTNEDQILLANRDKVSGKLMGLRDGKLQFNSSAAALEIPVQRVTQVLLSGSTTNVNPINPWEIQASVLGGGKISFALEKWSADKVFGQNQNFGSISLNSQSIRQIRFNPSKNKNAENEISTPDVLWEDNEP